MRMNDSELLRLITSGGDERISVDANGRNKYFMNPLESAGFLNRSSCTCSALSIEARPGVEALAEKLVNSDAAEEVYEDQRKRLHDFIDVKTPFDVFFAPSGSDLCYYSLLIANMINPDKPIMNIVTCPEELGSGSVLAYKGTFFSDYTQIEPVEKGEKVNKRLSISYLDFPARDKHGSILEHNQEIISDIKQFENSHFLIGNIVIGSKSGIENNLSIVEQTQDRNIMWVVDLCQLRTTKALIDRLMELNCCVMITGSKFYQSPPFCGAFLVPNKILQRIDLSRHEEADTDGFDRIFSYYDFPPQFPIRSEFQKKRNIGMLLRWEAALYEMKKHAEMGEEVVTDIIANWNDIVTEHIANSPYFELMKDQDITNKSIISFRVKVDDQYLSHQQLRKLYENISLESPKELPEFKRLGIGQPVAYAKGSFLRLALGLYNVRKLIEAGNDFSFEEKVIKVIERHARAIAEN